MVRCLMTRFIMGANRANVYLSFLANCALEAKGTIPFYPVLLDHQMFHMIKLHLDLRTAPTTAAVDQ